MGALQTKYDALNATAFPNDTIPPRFEDRAPDVWNGVPLYPPHVVMQLIASPVIQTFESDDIEESRLIATATYAKQQDADRAIKAIRFNGQNKDQLAGFDCGGLPALTEGVLLLIQPVRSPVPAVAGQGKDGAFFYKTVMEWLISVQRS